MDNLNPFVWALLKPARLYLKHFPIAHGKGLILRWVVTPALPRDGGFLTTLPGGARIRLHYRETLGLSTLLYGPFERPELEFAQRLLKPGDTAIDVGANVGVFTNVFAQAVGSTGAVLAIEPLATNVARLEENIAINGFEMIKVHVCALGAEPGEIQLLLADDGAYASTDQVAEQRGIGTAVRVPLRTLDSVWQDAGNPSVRLVKIDVEGGEPKVLEGASRLLHACRPWLLIEANAEERLFQVVSLLDPFGYVQVAVPGFAPWNYAFKPRDKNA